MTQINTQISTKYCRKSAVSILNAYQKQGFKTVNVLSLLIKSRSQEEFQAKLLKAFTPIKNEIKLKNGMTPFQGRIAALSQMQLIQKQLNKKMSSTEVCYCKKTKTVGYLDCPALLSSLEKVVPGITKKVLEWDFADN